MNYIGKSGYCRGELVHAAAGKTSYVMRIRKGGLGWETYYHEPNAKQAGGVFTYMTARTLRELDAKLGATRCTQN